MAQSTPFDMLTYIIFSSHIANFWGIGPCFQVMKVCCSFTEGMMAKMRIVLWKSRSAYRRAITI